MPANNPEADKSSQEPQPVTVLPGGRKAMLNLNALDGILRDGTAEDLSAVLGQLETALTEVRRNRRGRP